MSFINRAIQKLKNFFTKVKNQYRYDFLLEAEKVFPNSPNKAAESMRWLKQVRKDKNYQYKQKVPKGGRLYWFKYQDPLHKDTLPYWDAEPLVIMSSSFTTVNGERRVLGLNLHLLPPNIRVLVFAEIWNIHQTEFKKGLNDKDKQPTFEFSWRAIYPKIEKYGGDFAIRMYAPSQIRGAIEFPTEDWPKAVHIPSRRYIGTNLVKLRKEWETFLANKKK